MRVAFVGITPFPRTGGGWTFLEQLSSALTHSGHSSIILSPRQMPDLWVATVDRLAALVRAVFRSWLWFFLRLALSAFFLARLLRTIGVAFNPQIIDAQDPVAFLAVHRTARRMGIPVILTLHGYFHHESTWGSISAGSLWEELLKRIEREAFIRAPVIVTVDSRLRQYVERASIDPRKVRVRPNFVDCQMFVPASRGDMERARTTLGLRTNEKAICCVRRLERKSGVEYGIGATRILLERGVDATLFVAGLGSLDRELRALASNLGISERIRFLGNLPRDEILRLLWACDAAVVPSVTVGEEVEATSLSALESMAAGVPLVASKIGGLAEMVTDGMTGLLVQEKQARAIADALQIAFSEKGTELARNARSWVLEHASISRGLEDTLAIYQSVTTGRPTHAVSTTGAPPASDGP